MLDTWNTVTSQWNRKMKEIKLEPTPVSMVCVDNITGGIPTLVWGCEWDTSRNQVQFWFKLLCDLRPAQQVSVQLLVCYLYLGRVPQVRLLLSVVFCYRCSVFWHRALLRRLTYKPKTQINTRSHWCFNMLLKPTLTVMMTPFMWQQSMLNLWLNTFLIPHPAATEQHGGVFVSVFNLYHLLMEMSVL